MRELVLNDINMTQELSNEDLLELIDCKIIEVSRTSYIELNKRLDLRTKLFNSIRGLDVLEDFLYDSDISEIMVNGYQNIFIEKNGELIKTDKCFSSTEKLLDVIQQIVASSDRRINQASPIADTRLPNGSRVNIVLSPISIDGPAITIRRFPDSPLTMDRLIELNSITRQAADYLRLLVVAGYNIFISGGTGSGKTTFLNVLSGYIPHSERVITIEDSAELKLMHLKNIVRLEARQANTEGANAIPIRELIRTALRMRPSRIIVGEVRGAEAIDMIMAMSTGHDGSLSTGHGNSPYDMLGRLETMVLMGIDMPIYAIRKQIASAIDIMIHLGRLRDGSRRVLEISEISSFDNNEIHLNPLFAFKEKGESKDGKIIGNLEYLRNPIKNTFKLNLSGITKERLFEND